ncbi:MAG: TraB/GumN family protein [Gammaproteobacteria bacterium]|nr:MAG: TraB/GumN family protein [Gammaproteobacteria bacterium]
MNRLRILLATIWLCLAVTGHALPLWELEGTHNRIVILGSVHFLRAEDAPLPEAIARVYADADVIVFEVDLGRLDPLEIQSVLARLALDAEGRDLEDILGHQDYRTAAQLAAGVDIDLNTLRPYEPWYAALQITQLRLLQLGFDGSFGVETQMTLKAVADGKPIVGLESLEEQFGALDSLPATAQRVFLMQTLEDAGTISEELDTIVAAWKAGDMATLEQTLMAGLEDQQALRESVLVQRNRNWTRQIIEFTKQSRDYLIIVGALHLVGEDSVIRMLEEAGISSRRIH